MLRMADKSLANLAKVPRWSPIDHVKSNIIKCLFKTIAFYFFFDVVHFNVCTDKPASYTPVIQMALLRLVF